MGLYGLIGLVLLALFGVLYSFIILVSVDAAVQHIRHLENWWNRRYNPCECNPSEEAPKDTLWNHTAWWNPIPSVCSFAEGLSDYPVLGAKPV
jgi:hypothetical protein